MAMRELAAEYNLITDDERQSLLRIGKIATKKHKEGQRAFGPKDRKTQSITEKALRCIRTGVRRFTEELRGEAMEALSYLSREQLKEKLWQARADKTLAAGIEV